MEHVKACRVNESTSETVKDHPGERKWERREEEKDETKCIRTDALADASDVASMQLS